MGINARLAKRRRKAVFSGVCCVEASVCFCAVSEEILSLHEALGAILWCGGQIASSISGGGGKKEGK